MNDKCFEKYDECYVLYVNLTTTYTSFKIERGRFLGPTENNISDKEYFAIEHEDDEVNYVQIDDIFKTEMEAFEYLRDIMNIKLSGGLV